MICCLMLIGIVVCICDALRDRWSSRIVEWWKWHMVKWMAFFSPFVVVFLLLSYPVSLLDIGIFFCYGVVCHIVWKLTYKYSYILEK